MWLLYGFFGLIRNSGLSRIYRDEVVCWKDASIRPGCTSSDWVRVLWFQGHISLCRTFCPGRCRSCGPRDAFLHVASLVQIADYAGALFWNGCDLLASIASVWDARWSKIYRPQTMWTRARDTDAVRAKQAGDGGGAHMGSLSICNSTTWPWMY